jgi:hypothetical protein
VTDPCPFTLVAAVSDSMELIGLTLLVLGLLVAASLLTAGFSFAFAAAARPPVHDPAGGQVNHPRDAGPTTTTRVVQLPD